MKELGEIDLKSKGKLFFSSGEKSEEIVTEFPWWDKKDFELGYFRDVLKKLENFVSKEETVAICFSSTKSILTFIHCLNKFTDYQFKKDYWIFKSPSLCHHDYSGQMKRVLNSFGKGNKPVCKFLLCTSYTEMGVDFSVKNMIIEVSFLSNLLQQIGRLNRWYEYGDGSSVIVVPSIFRENEDGFINGRYKLRETYDWLCKFYREKSDSSLDNNWFVESDLNDHFDRQILSKNEEISRDFINTCGLFRTKFDRKMNSMYRDISNKTVEIEGCECDVPVTRLNSKGDLNVVPHPELFV